MRTLVLGGTGMLGRAVVREARARGGAALGLAHGQADITDAEAVRHWLAAFRPQVVVNCAALTRVDDCEEQVAEAMRVNGRAVGALAAAASEAGARLVHVSTDYVFDGAARAPIPEDAAPAPLSVYGESKLLGEREALAAPGALVVRTSLVFGPGGENFVAAMARRLGAGGSLRVVDDQTSCPTYSRFLARALCDLVARGASGIVHYGNTPGVSRFGLVQAIAAALAPGARVEPAKTSEYPRPARRPAYSVLDLRRFETLAGRPPQPWSWGPGEYPNELRMETNE
jgi:dTDP-4-dehydrorhamnose reductase